MAFYQFTRFQKLPASVSQVWDFFSSPVNLKEITPEYLNFVITSSNVEERIYPGMMITYKVSPLLGIAIDWLTESTHVKDYEYFIDEQKVGPYALWHHLHKIEPIEGGVLMKDVVTYQPPFGLLGAISNSLFIRKKLFDIFDFRKIALEKRFANFDR